MRVKHNLWYTLHMKQCTVCQEYLPEDSFHFRNRAKGTRMNQCKLCGNKRAINYYHKNGGYENAKKKRRRHGMTYSERLALEASQDGKCKICGESDKKLVVDHDHSCCPGAYSCGECIRGLLCGDCNRGLGGFRDSPTLLLNAMSYLGA